MKSKLFQELSKKNKVGNEKMVDFTAYVIHYVIINFGVHNIYWLNSKVLSDLKKI